MRADGISFDSLEVARPMIATTVAIMSPAPTSSATVSPACGSETPLHVDVYRTDVNDAPTLRFIRLLATAEPKVRQAAIDAAKVPVDAATTAAVDAAISSSTTCASALAAVITQRMGDAVSATWNITDDAQADRFATRLEFLSRALAVRGAIDPARIDPLLAPYGTTLAALSSASAAPRASEPCTAADVPARTVRIAQPTYPEIAGALGITGNIQVKVALDTDGDVVSVSLFKRPLSADAGTDALVSSTIFAAANTLYAPEVRACRTMAGTYLFSSSFTAHR